MPQSHYTFTNVGAFPGFEPRSYGTKFGLAIHQSDHQERRRFVEWAQNEIAVVPDFHKRILFSDEAPFWLNGYVNKQNCRIWSEANPQVYVETPLHPKKLTVWCALWAGGIIGPYFFKNDEGHNVTVNGDRYRAMQRDDEETNGSALSLLDPIGNSSSLPPHGDKRAIGWPYTLDDNNEYVFDDGGSETPCLFSSVSKRSVSPLSWGAAAPSYTSNFTQFLAHRWNPAVWVFTTIGCWLMSCERTPQYFKGARVNVNGECYLLREADRAAGWRKTLLFIFDSRSSDQYLHFNVCLSSSYTTN
ncbi:putative DD41D transposase [Trichonephila clavipes]|nr:putative DD41D transposase [Trichonephila clavipes]